MSVWTCPKLSKYQSDKKENISLRCGTVTCRKHVRGRVGNLVTNPQRTLHHRYPS